jgi:hypothetical protein
MTCPCTPCAIERIEFGTLTQLTAGTDALPKAVGAGILFASADTLASHAQGAAYDGAAEEFQQDHGGVE